MSDRWSEHPVRLVPVRCPASVAMAVVTLLIAIAARLTPLLASGAAKVFDFQVWRPLVFSLTTSSVISAVLTGLLLVLIGYQIEPMIGSVQFAFLTCCVAWVGQRPSAWLGCCTPLRGRCAVCLG